MEMLAQLGINATALIQFGIYLITLIFLNLVVFKPYFHAYQQRKQRTQGSEAGAVDAQKQTLELQAIYEQKAKAHNAQVVQILDAAKKTAAAAYEAKISKARSEADSTIKENKDAIQKSVASATEQLKAQSSQVALAMTSKLLEK